MRVTEKEKKMFSRWLLRLGSLCSVLNEAAPDDSAISPAGFCYQSLFNDIFDEWKVEKCDFISEECELSDSQ